MQQTARLQQTAHRREGRHRIGHVLDRVVERDNVEARLREIERLEPTGVHAKSLFPRALRREGRDLDSLDVPTRGLRLDEEVAERATHVQQLAATSIAPFDRLDALAEGATVDVRIQEVVRVAALRVVCRVVIGVVELGRRQRPSVLAHEAAAAARDHQRAIDLEERPRAGLRAQRAVIGDLCDACGSEDCDGRARKSDARERAHDGTVATPTELAVPSSGDSASRSRVRSSTTLYAKAQNAMRKATVAMTLP